MSHLRIKTMTIDSHDESIPVVSLRFVEIDGINHHLARDVGRYLGLKVDDDGDYRSVLTKAGIPFVDLPVFHRDQPLGLHALISEAAFNQARGVKHG